MKNKRIFCLALAALMTLSSVGCGSEVKKTEEVQKETQNEVTEETQKSEASEEPQEVVTINWVKYGTAVNADEEKVETAINEYIEPLIGVNVNVSDTTTTDLKLSIAAGDDIDVFWTASWTYIQDYIDGNAAYDLTEIITEYDALYNSIPESVWDSMKQNGKIWYVPIYKENATGGGLAIRRDLVEKCNFDLSTIKQLWDIEPLLEQAYADGMTNAFTFSSTTNGFVQIDYWRVNDSSHYVISKENPEKVECTYFTEWFQKLAETMYSWQQKGYINSADVDKDVRSKYVENFKNGQSAVMQWSNTPDGDANASSRVFQDMVTVDLTGSYTTQKSAMGSTYMINAKTEKLDACLKFLELLYTDTYLADLVCYGIEGEHYDRDENGKVQMRADSKYACAGVWALTNVMAPSLQVGESDNKKEAYDEFNQNAQLSYIADFVVDNVPIEAELSAVNAVFNEYVTMLCCGFYNPDEKIPEFQKALKAAGIDTIIEEYQKQYDAWRQNK